MKTTLLILCWVTAGLNAHAQLVTTGDTVRIKTPELSLAGTLTIPTDQRQPLPVVLWIAGSGQTDQNGNSGAGYKTNMYRQLADSLLKQGIALLRYDKRGVGSSKVSDRTLLNRSVDDMVTDAVAWIRYLQVDKRFSRVIVAGHSEGSLVGMLAAKQTKANGFISVAGAGRNITGVLKVQLQDLPDSLRAVAYHDLDSLRAGQSVQRPPMALMSLFHPRIQPYVISWMRYDPAVEVKSYAGPVLILQGKHDMQVAVTEAELLKAARPDARLLLFDEMSHILKNGPNDRLGSFATYNQPDLPLTTGLAAAIAEFAKKPR